MGNSMLVFARELSTNSPLKSSRFAELLSHNRCLRPIYDEVLLESDGYVVTPTLGSILPHWMLAIPRLSIENFAKWRVATQLEPTGIVENVLTALAIDPERTVWFEHGATEVGTSVGCGVDQAHLHILVDPPFSFKEFEAAVCHASAMSWCTMRSQDAYESLDPGTPYLLAAALDRAVLAKSAQVAGSQFFRRVVAALAGTPNAWNYKTHAHLANVAKTIERFKPSSMLAQSQ